MGVGDWAATGGQAAAEGLWNLLALAGPSVCAVLLVFLVVRGILRGARYRAVRAFTEDDRRAVRDAIVAAERKTVGEILPVVVERSDPHPAAEWLAALSFVVVGSTLLIVILPWKHPAWVLGEQAFLGIAGFVLARWLPDLKRSFVLETRASAVTEEQSFQEFYRNGLHRTRAATGVLLFVSLFERRVVVVADEGIDAKVDAATWEAVDRLVLDGIRSGSLRDGLVAGIGRAGNLLSEHFPWVEGDRNEIPDRVIVRAE